jgi:hypothetical protein
VPDGRINFFNRPIQRKKIDVKKSHPDIKKTFQKGVSCLYGRVARWFVFKPKIPIWVNFGGSCYAKSWYIL